MTHQFLFFQHFDPTALIQLYQMQDDFFFEIFYFALKMTAIANPHHYRQIFNIHS